MAEFGDLGDTPGDLPRTKGLAVDGEGRIWISDGILDVVSVFGAEGQFLASYGKGGEEPGEFGMPAGIAVDPKGRVAVADSLNGRVQILLRSVPANGNGKHANGNGHAVKGNGNGNGYHANGTKRRRQVGTGPDNGAIPAILRAVSSLALGSWWQKLT